MNAGDADSRDFHRAGNCPQHKTPMAEEAEEIQDMTPEANTKKKKLVRLRNALWSFAKLVGGVAAYLAALALVVGQLTAQVNAEKLSLSAALVMSVYITAVIHWLISMMFVCQD